VGLGNPGPDYDETRHNVGWWAVDRFAYDWDFGPFRREGTSYQVQGVVRGAPTRLVKPATYMNRSGRALTFLRDFDDFVVARDLLIVVDDAALDVGRMRLRPSGSAGGHNGLRSIADALGTTEYPRLRIGVGRPPEGADMVDWVLSAMSEEEETAVLDLLPEATRAVESWIDDGIEEAMNRFNR